MSRKSQVVRLDKLWSKAIIERDNQTCQRCFEFGDNPHHIIPRRYLTTRHDLNNGLTLCTKCHIFLAHGNPDSFIAWFCVNYGPRYKGLQNLKNEIKPDLDKVELELREGRY